MENWKIKAASRHIARSVRSAIQGNVTRALVELITNSDDSYIRLEDEGGKPSGKIEILYKKEGHAGCFAVRDYAEGMSEDDVKNKFKEYGAATSGLNKGKSVRGYFGQGAKDALGAMEDGRICTFRDDCFIEFRIYLKKGLDLFCEMEEPVKATDKLRKEYNIDGNGSIAFFKADPKKENGIVVPRFNSLQTSLTNNFLLRKILSNPNRYVVLINLDTGIKRSLRYTMPAKSVEVLKEDFIVTYSKYGDFPVSIEVNRSENELTQSSEERDGGLLITDDKYTVLDLSLFKYNEEPFAAHLWGEVKIGRFRELLKEEEPVLSEERNGLSSRHPFCQDIIREIEKRLEAIVLKERERKNKQEANKFDLEEIARYKKAFSLLNEIAEKEIEESIYLGKESKEDIELPPNGLCLYPSFAQITVGKKYSFQVKIDAAKFKKGSEVKIKSTDSKLRVLSKDFKLPSDNEDSIITKYVSIEGIEPNIEAKLLVSINNVSAEAKVQIVPEGKEFLLTEGMAFEPSSITLRPNVSRKIYLLVYIKVVEDGSVIKLSTDNKAINLSKEDILVVEANAVSHVAKFEIDIWGDGDGQEGIITASFGSYIALLDVKIKSKVVSPDKSKQGMFNEPEPVFDLEPTQPVHYSIEDGRIYFYVNYPTVKLYVGESCQYRKKLSAQVFLANLIAEKCFSEIAKKKSEKAAIIKASSINEWIQRETLKITNQYGRKIHEALIDQDLLRKERM